MTTTHATALFALASRKDEVTIADLRAALSKHDNDLYEAVMGDGDTTEEQMWCAHDLIEGVRDYVAAQSSRQLRHKRLKKYTHVPCNDDGYEDARGKVTTGSLGLSLFDEVDGGLTFEHVT